MPVHSSKFILYFLTNKNKEPSSSDQDILLNFSSQIKQTKTKNLRKLEMFKNTKTSDSLEQQLQQEGLAWLPSMEY